MNDMNCTPAWIWHRTLDVLSHSFTTDLGVFFAQVNVIAFENDTLILHTGMPWGASILNDSLDTIEQALSEVLERTASVKIFDDRQLEAYRLEASGAYTRKLDPNKSFDNFIVGRSNQIAHAAARAVATCPAEAYNPLVLYGESGSGKTHLISAIGNDLIQMRPDLQIKYITGEEFVRDLITTIKETPLYSIKKCTTEFLKADVLLLDNVQYLANKDYTQEAFLDIIEALVAEKKQVVLTIDRPPALLEKMDARIRRRCCYGLITDVSLRGPHDSDTIDHLLNYYADVVNVPIPEFVRMFVLENVFDGFVLQGIVKYLCALKDLQMDVTPEEIQKHLIELL